MLYFLLRISILSYYTPQQRPGAHYAAWREIFNLCSRLALQLCSYLKTWWSGLQLKMRFKWDTLCY